MKRTITYRWGLPGQPGPPEMGDWTTRIEYESEEWAIITKSYPLPTDLQLFDTIAQEAFEYYRAKRISP